MEKCRADGGLRRVVKVSELNKSMKERAYQECLYGKYGVLRGGGRKCGERVGKIQRCSEEVYQ